MKLKQHSDPFETITRDGKKYLLLSSIQLDGNTYVYAVNTETPNDFWFLQRNGFTFTDITNETLLKKIIPLLNDHLLQKLQQIQEDVDDE